MENNFEQLMAHKSDAELMLYIDNAEKYTQEAVSAAIAELQKRGKEISTAEAAAISARIESRHEELMQQEKRSFGLISPWNNENIVEDERASQLYSPRAIYIFSILFSLVAGSILLAMNVKDKKARWPIIVYGIAYTVFAMILGANIQINSSTGFSFLINGLGAIIMMFLFWNKRVGNIQFRTRPIWKPLIICIIIFLPIVAFFIWASTLQQ